MAGIFEKGLSHARGDYEGSFLFDPENETQVAAALKGIKARKKRIMTEPLLEALRKARLLKKSAW
jgi:hypothetical protein